MFVTTIEKTNHVLNQKALKTAEQLGIPYIERNKKTIKQLQSYYNQPCLVVGKIKTELYDLHGMIHYFFIQIWPQSV